MPDMRPVRPRRTVARISDAPCPSCGSLLWFVRFGGQNVLVQPNEAGRRRALAGVLSELTGVSEAQLHNDPEAIGRLELDSADLVEIVMALEDWSAE